MLKFLLNTGINNVPKKSLQSLILVIDYADPQKNHVTEWYLTKLLSLLVVRLV